MLRPGPQIGASTQPECSQPSSLCSSEDLDVTLMLPLTPTLAMALSVALYLPRPYLE
jgi:hypothetical protein